MKKKGRKEGRKASKDPSKEGITKSSEKGEVSKLRGLKMSEEIL